MPPRDASAPPPGSADDKLIGIELLRFASAVAVLVFHYQHFAYVGTSLTNFHPAAQPFYGALRLFYDYGFCGVEVFWCISGFIFFWKYGEVVSQKRMAGRKFFVLRMSRLYPLHIATLLFIAAMQFVYSLKLGEFFIYPNNDVVHFILQIFMASNWSTRFGDSFNGPIWSISIEVLTYCIFFLSLRYISASVAFIGAVAVAAAGVLFLKISAHPLFNCLMFFYLGGLVAALYSRAKAAAGWKVIATGAAVACLAIAIGLPMFHPVTPLHLLVIFSPALIFLSVMYVPGTPLVSRLLAAAGNMTYSSYLLHVPIQITIATIAAYAHWSIPMYTAWFFIGFLIVTLVLSYCCYVAFEMPMQSYLRRRFR